MRFFFSVVFPSYQQILLYLLVQLVQFALSVIQCGAGLMVTLFPLVEILLVQILVGQRQRSQAIPCKLLQMGVHILIWTDTAHVASHT